MEELLEPERRKLRSKKYFLLESSNWIIISCMNSNEKYQECLTCLVKFIVLKFLITSYLSVIKIIVSRDDLWLLRYEKSIRNNCRRCEIVSSCVWCMCMAYAPSFAILHSRTASKESSIKCQTVARGTPKTSQQPVFCSRQPWASLMTYIHPGTTGGFGIFLASLTIRRLIYVEDFHSDNRTGEFTARSTRHEKSRLCLSPKRYMHVFRYILQTMEI